MSLQTDETGIIQGFLDGDAESMETVDGWIRQAAWPFRRRLADLWEDLLQDVRLEIFRLLKEEKFRGDASLKTYLWRVTSNACVDKVRSQRRVHWEELDEAESYDPRPREELFQHMTDQENRDLAARVLAEMGEECIRLWRMVFGGLSYRQMSRKTGVKEGALRVRVLRCRKKAQAIREELEHHNLQSGRNTTP